MNTNIRSGGIHLSLKQITIWISIYGLLLFDSGYFFVSQGGIFLGLQIVFALLLLFFSGGKIRITNVVVLLLFFFFITASSVINGEPARNLLVTSIELLVSFLIAESIMNSDGAHVIDISRKILILISIESIALYLICLLRIDALSILPLFHNSGEMPAYFAGLSFAYAPREYYVARNLGLFWEPGAFSTYLLLALGCEMFVFSEHKKAVLVLVSIAIFTTLSTTGIICGLGLWIVFALTNEKKKQGILLTILLAIVISVFVIASDRLPEYIRFSIFTKVRAIITGRSQDYQTVNTRMESIILGLRLFFRNPVTGIGRGLDQLKEAMGNGTASCTPVNWFAQYGVFVGLLSLVGLVRAIRQHTRTTTQMISLLVIALLSVSSEAFNYSPTIYFIVFYGLSVRKPCQEE